MHKRLEVVLIDVGGTLWPNSWPIRLTDAAGRRRRIAAAMDGHDPKVVEALAADLVWKSRAGDEARQVTTESKIDVAAEVLIAGCLQRQRLPTDRETIARLRRAMAIPIHDNFQPLPGALELLQAIRSMGLRSVIASNTYWRDAGSYWDDFRKLGMAEYIADIVTSVDAGHLKPHPAVFEMAMRRAGVTAERCVVIGNREENDITPARALGMRTILVHPDDPVPTQSRANAVAPDLWKCVSALRNMLDTEVA
ncbi:MAG TPA: HAD family hydrolase [Candidatus Dormibacteraeota bacterium]|nr:HAD family hydrolase [Candidatus Dormibacteraeota bacterium]